MGNVGIGWWIDDFLDSSQRSWNFTGLWCWYGRPRERKTERRINYRGPLVSKLRIHTGPITFLEGKTDTSKAQLLIHLWQNQRQGAARNYGYLKNILVLVSEKCQIQPTTYKINTTQQLYKWRKSHYCVLARQHIYEFLVICLKMILFLKPAWTSHSWTRLNGQKDPSPISLGLKFCSCCYMCFLYFNFFLHCTEFLTIWLDSLIQEKTMKGCDVLESRENRVGMWCTCLVEPSPPHLQLL